jgi:serine/threonine protein kinase
VSSSEPQLMLLHYRLGAKIGSGGMGEVYKAEDTKLGRTVAIKLPPPDTHHDANARRRFFREAQLA